jgi:hypothetical protein
MRARASPAPWAGGWSRGVAWYGRSRLAWAWPSVVWSGSCDGCRCLTDPLECVMCMLCSTKRRPCRAIVGMASLEGGLRKDAGESNSTWRCVLAIMRSAPRSLVVEKFRLLSVETRRH